MKKRIVKNSLRQALYFGHKGQSLLPVLIGMPLVAITILTLNRGLINSVKGARDITGRASFESLNRSIHLILDHKSSCLAAFNGVKLNVNPSPTPSANISLANSKEKKEPDQREWTTNVSLKLGQTVIASSGIQGNNMSLTNVSLKEVDPTLRETCNGQTTYAMSLSLAGKKNVYQGSQYLAKSHLVYLTTDANKNVIGCSSESSPCAIPSPSPIPQLVKRTIRFTGYNVGAKNQSCVSISINGGSFQPVGCSIPAGGRLGTFVDTSFSVLASPSCNRIRIKFDVYAQSSNWNWFLCKDTSNSDPLCGSTTYPDMAPKTFLFQPDNNPSKGVIHARINDNWDNDFNDWDMKLEDVGIGTKAILGIQNSSVDCK